MSDEGFHEIQLNGKQLVFLFMAATVVSVVIFLLGVMVGRGVRAPGSTDGTQIAERAPVDPTVALQSTTGSVSLNSDRTPVSAQESLTYAERLAAPTPPQDTLPDLAPIPPPSPISTPTPPSVEAPPPVVSDPPPAAKQPPVVKAAAPSPPVPAAQADAFTEPPGNGLAVQVGAYPRDTAGTIARRLASKGYPVFVTPRPQGLFAVRVGKYTDRREADAVVRRLETEEQFNNPWVTR